MATASSSSKCEGTTTVTTTETPDTPVVLHLRRTESQQQPGVSWATDVVDNEHLNKKKSKCCCIYKRKKKWDESDDDESDEEGETEHCRGHPEAKKKNQHQKDCDCH